jgi:hypothetical protein
MRDFSQVTIIELAAIVAEHLMLHGIEVVLVGGLAVEIYTDNDYLTLDIDMVNTNYQKPQRLHTAMAGLGFYKQGRIYVNDTTSITVEFPSGPLSIGDELINKTTFFQVTHGAIPILMVDDVIKDRLAAFIHWRDRQSLIQAVAVALKHQREPIDFEQFCLKEGSAQHYQTFSEFFMQARRQNIQRMSDLEPILTHLLLSNL